MCCIVPVILEKMKEDVYPLPGQPHASGVLRELALSCLGGP